MDCAGDLNAILTDTRSFWAVHVQDHKQGFKLDLYCFQILLIFSIFHIFCMTSDLLADQSIVVGIALQSLSKAL